MKNIGIFLFSFLLFPPTADYTTSRHSFHSFHLNTLTPWSWCEIRKSLQRLASFPMILTVKVSIEVVHLDLRTTVIRIRLNRGAKEAVPLSFFPFIGKFALEGRFSLFLFRRERETRSPHARKTLAHADFTRRKNKGRRLVDLSSIIKR